MRYRTKAGSIVVCNVAAEKIDLHWTEDSLCGNIIPNWCYKNCVCVCVCLCALNLWGSCLGGCAHLLIPWCTVLLEQLTGLQVVKKFHAFHGTRRFITELTSVRHVSLSWASPVQSIYPYPTSWRSILILSTHLRLGLSSGPLATKEMQIYWLTVRVLKFISFA